MGTLEYIQASLQLFNDPGAYDSRDRDHISRHILAWPGVRRWSQYTWDSIEQGRHTWQDQAVIQDARVRISYTSGPIASTPTVQPTPKPKSVEPQDLIHVVCRDFNAPGGCKFSGNHDVGQVKKLHICAYCDTVGRKSGHSIQRCRSKSNNPNNNFHQQNDNRGWAGAQYRQQPDNNYSQAQGQQGPYNRQQYNQQFPKNG